MCPHLLIGCAMVVVVVGEDELEAVGAEDGVALVLRHEAEELPPAEGGFREVMGRRLQRVEDGKGGVGAIVDDGLRRIKDSTLLPVAHAGSEHDGCDNDV